MALALLFRHRLGRETKTSSDASDEAPERARKDTSEEAKLHLCGSAILCVFPVEFLRLPSDASHVRGGGLGETALPRGNSVLPRRFESLRLALAATLYQKSGLLAEISRREISAAGLSGLSLPDAHYEHTSIRASATNLTKKLNAFCQILQGSSISSRTSASLSCNLTVRRLRI